MRPPRKWRLRFARALAAWALSRAATSRSTTNTLALTADLLRQPVAVIYAGDNITAVMVKSATTTIPVVFRIGSDPIQLGLVTSLSRPDGNMSGVSFLGTATGAIRLQMLREAVPNAAVMGLLVNPANPNAELDSGNLPCLRRHKDHHHEKENCTC